MDKQIVLEKIKKARLQRFMTNCYSLDVLEHSQKLWFQGNEFVFSYEDHGIQRLVYFVRTWETLDHLLDEVEKGRFYLEFMTKDPDEYKPHKALLTAAMMRMSNTDCSRVFDSDSSIIHFKNAVPVETANEQDATEINSILWSTFHTEVSHLLSEEELREKIQAGHITIHRNDAGKIDALLQAEVMPKKFYINQVVNKGNREVIHALLLNRLEKYIKVGGKYLYAWVEDKNTASIKFHQKYGMTYDGMWSMVYSIER